jgi:hypothetical protein
MKKQSNDTNKRLESWINNRLFKTLNPKDWEIESILYIYNNEKDSNIRGRSEQSKHSSRRNS